MPWLGLCFAREDGHRRCPAATRRRPHARWLWWSHKGAPAGPMPTRLMLCTANDPVHGMEICCAGHAAGRGRGGDHLVGSAPVSTASSP